jgi:hypothetical protein
VGCIGMPVAHYWCLVRCVGREQHLVKPGTMSPYTAASSKVGRAVRFEPSRGVSHSSWKTVSDPFDFDVAVNERLNQFLGGLDASDDHVNRVQACNYVGSDNRKLRVIDHDDLLS